MHHEVKFVLKNTCGVLLLCVILILFLKGINFAESLLIGGLVVIIPHFVFAKVFFYFQGARKYKQIIKYFYLGEGLKLLLTALFLGIALAYFKLETSGFFMGFIGVIILQIGLSLSVGSRKMTTGVK